MDKKEQWANEVIQSLKGITKVTPSDALFDNILQQLSAQKVAVIPLKRLAWVAAAACVVIALNVIALNHSEANQTPKTDELLSNYNIYQS